MKRFFSFLLMISMFCGAMAELKYVEISTKQNLPTIQIKSIDDFEKIINSYNISIVFLNNMERTGSEALVMTNGTYFSFPMEGYKTLSDYRAGKNASFRSSADYEKAKNLGIEKSDIYYYYERNSFKNLADCMDAYNNGFVSVSSSSYRNDSEKESTSYYEAKKLGYGKYSDYKEYLNYTANGFKTKDEWLLAKSKGFYNASVLKTATEAGFSNNTEYQKAVQYGLKTKSELTRYEEITGEIDKIAEAKKWKRPESALYYFLRTMPKGDWAVSAVPKSLADSYAALTTVSSKGEVPIKSDSNSRYGSYSTAEGGLRNAIGSFIGKNQDGYRYEISSSSFFSESAIKSFFQNFDVSEIGSYNKEREIFSRNGKNPVFVPEKKQAANKSNSENEKVVYWTTHGKKFHTHEDCEALDRNEALHTTSVAEAKDAGKGTVCKFCERKDSAALEAAQNAIDSAPAVNQ